MSGKGRTFAIRLAMVLGVGLFTAGCATTLKLTSTPQIPAAEGKVKFDRTKNNNTSFDLRVKHLAPADRIAPGATVFVVWVRGLEAGARPHNMGALQVDKKLKGRIRGITPLTAFDMYMTCETDQTATAPTGVELLPIRYERK